jgi:tRNA1Val (adenine37-N6)-methyltransferase
MSGSDFEMSRKTHFHFKKFSISHSNSTMKVGTDAVLLGAWAHVGGAKQLLDIGTGTGTIALMLAQRSDELAKIDAIEIASSEALEADENFNRSPWPHKMQIHHSSIQTFYPHKKYDVIVSNPPYFSNSQIPADEKRYHSRHTVKLNHNDLTTAVERLLDDNGNFSVVLPYEEGIQFISLAESRMLHCSRRFSFRTRVDKKIERWLLEFQWQPKATETGEITLYKDKTGDFWDDSYINLTKDFYLKL